MNDDVSLISRAAAWAERKLGIKPSLTNALLTTVALAVLNTVLAGDPLDVDALKVAVYAAVIGIVIGVSPPVTNRTTDEVSLYRH